MTRKLTKAQLRILRRVCQHVDVEGHYAYWPRLSSSECEQCTKLARRGLLHQGWIWTYKPTDKGRKAVAA